MRRCLAAFLTALLLLTVPGCALFRPRISKTEAIRLVGQLQTWEGEDWKERREQIKKATLESVDLKSVLVAAADSRTREDLAKENPAIAKDADAYCPEYLEGPLLPIYATWTDKERSGFRRYVEAHSADELFDGAWESLSGKNTGSDRTSKSISAEVLTVILDATQQKNPVVEASGPATVSVGHFKEGIGPWADLFEVEKRDKAWVITKVLTLGDDLVALEKKVRARGEAKPDSAEIQKVFGKYAELMWAGQDTKGAWWAAVKAPNGTGIGVRGSDGVWKQAAIGSLDFPLTVPPEVSSALARAGISLGGD